MAFRSSANNNLVLPVFPGDHEDLLRIISVVPENANCVSGSENEHDNIQYMYNRRK
jgi:hypothetical protein